MKKYTVYVNEAPVKHFDNPIDAEDFTKSFPENMEITVWDNENECEFYFRQDSVIFHEKKQFGDITREMWIYRFDYKIQASVMEKCQDSGEPIWYKRNFMLTKTFPTYRQLVEKAKKHFDFAEK